MTSKSKLKSVTLPDGRVAQVTDTPQAWWTKDGATGYVHPSMIAADPAQPREHMDPTELAELTESVTERGVREPIPVTPLSLAPWATVVKEDEHLPFLIVTGHRRKAASLAAVLEAVPVRIVCYKNKSDYLMDASILNNNRANLTAIEEGREIVRLRQCGVTVEKIRKSRGKSVTYIYNRINLTRLHPMIQALLDPKLQVKRRLALTVAEDLGGVDAPTVNELEEMLVIFDKDVRKMRVHALAPLTSFENLTEDERRFQAQKILYTVVVTRNLSSERAREIIKEHKLQQAAAHGNTAKQTRRFQPHKRREILANLAGDVLGSTVVDWTPDEFRRILKPAGLDAVAKLRNRFHEASTMFADWTKLFDKIIKEMKEESGVIELSDRKKA